jgi:hypothetical protein
MAFRPGFAMTERSAFYSEVVGHRQDLSVGIGKAGLQQFLQTGALGELIQHTAGPTTCVDAVTAGSRTAACWGLRRLDGINSPVAGSSFPTHICLLRAWPSPYAIRTLHRKHR